ncbi:MAG: DNA primase [Cyanobacteriota bacterium]
MNSNHPSHPSSPRSNATAASSHSPSNPSFNATTSTGSNPSSPPSANSPSRPVSPHHRRPRPCPDHVIAAVREKARIAELFPVSALQRSGRAFLTTYPCHTDRRPSLTVNPQTNRVHCFVCDKGTDAIGWLQDRQGLTFSEAVQELAERYGIPIPEEDPEAAARAEAEHKERQRLLAWRERQQREFHQALLDDLNQLGPAAIALRQRGLSEETAITWGLGLNGTRLMLPIADSQGRVRAFSGRTLTGEEPKYRNSANDALFRKQELLFGLHHAAEAIRRGGEALLVEGPLDVIQLHQAGFPTAVASMGTSLSPEQRQALLRAGAKRLLIAYDGDTAGHRATGRLIEAHRAHVIAGQLELAVVALPAGSDPDALIRSHGSEALRRHLQAASHWLHWELDQLLAPLQADPENLSVVQHAEQEAKRLLALLPQGALRQRAEQRLKESLGVVAPVAHAPKGRGGEAGQLKGGKAWAPCGASAAERPAGVGSRGAGLEERRGTSAENTAIERAEFRALRLFLSSPVCRDPLAVLVISNDLFRRAQQCLVEAHRRLNQPVRSAQEDPLPRAILAICPQLEPHLAALLQRMCTMDAGAREALFQAPEGEMMAILDVLEPVE